MPTMQIRTEELISATDIQRKAKDIFAQLANGTQSKFVVMRNNEMAAVVLPVAQYEAMLDELEDLRIDAIARERLANFESSQLISHDEMLAAFDMDPK